MNRGEWGSESVNSRSVSQWDSPETVRVFEITGFVQTSRLS